MVEFTQEISLHLLWKTISSLTAIALLRMVVLSSLILVMVSPYYQIPHLFLATHGITMMVKISRMTEVELLSDVLFLLFNSIIFYNHADLFRVGAMTTAVEAILYHFIL